MRLAAATLATLAALVVSSSSGAATATGPCGSRAGAPAHVSHVIWIWFENHAAGEIVDNPAAPRATLLAHDCGFAEQYYAVAHPSLPNYLAATSGSTQGVRDDGAPSAHPLRAASLFGQAASARSYEENMPALCALADAYPYATKHNPEAYYLGARARCRTGDVPLGTPTRGAFATALANGTLPAFSFVTPNLCNDMHDCPVATGDAWLGSWLVTITNSSSYRAGHTVVFVVWDEDDGSAANRVPLLVISPWTKPGTRSTTRFTHYSLLRTTEDLLGIRAHLGNAATATSLRSAFGL
jgi:phosphatidylinositol-3-phosphatase